MLSRMKRRDILQQMAVAGTLLAPPLARAGPSDKLGSVLPMRTLGKSGERVTCLGLGGYHVGHAKNAATAQAVIEKALESGIRFFDTAESYQHGESERRYGKYLVPRYRDDIFLMTKSTARSATAAREHLEGSLRRLNTDVIDLWQIHALMDTEDTDARLTAGILDAAMKAQSEGKIRHIGFTGHASPYAHIRMTEHKAVLDACTACQMPVNPVDASSEHSFIGKTMPKLLKNDIGILAMKTLADGRFFSTKDRNGDVVWTSDNPVVPNVLSVEECTLFALSLPVAVLIIGAEIPEYVSDKVAIAKRFTALTREQRMALVEKVAVFAEEGEVEYYKNEDLRPGLRKS
jgi:aryl-alcohol dehydrogenase-like predicted oxidoreductase